MATCNGARFLQEQLNSLAGQTQNPAELVISDDASTDETIAIAHDFAQSAPFPVKILRNDTRLGYGENFMRAAKSCSGDWIAFCDQDDVWRPEKLAWCASQISSELCLIAHNATVCDEELNPRGLLYQYPEQSITGPWGLPPEWHCIGMTQVFRANLLSYPSDNRPSFPWHEHKSAHDVWIALLANARGGVLRSNRSLVNYRRHSATITENGQAQSLLANNGAEYRQRAEYLEQLISILEPLGFDVSGLRTRRDQFGKRHLAYTEPARIARLKALISLGPAFGAKRMLKDAFFALRGSLPTS
jgi:glycosyltransferase involved in cell wall biosynthesis